MNKQTDGKTGQKRFGCSLVETRGLRCGGAAGEDRYAIQVGVKAGESVLEQYQGESFACA